ncbi:MAG: lamin tail domain-containing protein [Myxococcales bacterium]|nr:lamin tail domain-containing protein [Myxococcales bacterium]
MIGRGCSMLRRLLGVALVMAIACGDDDGVPMVDGGGDDAMAPIDGGADGGSDAGRDAGGCVDEDGDGYGEGCALGPDCDDDDATVNPGATEVCDGRDNDCDGNVDEEVAGPLCGLTAGVCAGARARCRGAEGFLACDAEDYGDDFELVETACDGLDNDCDGEVDEGCPCEAGETRPCGSDVGACMVGTQTCGETGWGACAGGVEAMGETCNGLDDDCNGTVDDGLTAPLCPLQQGVCSGSRRACGGVAGWIACTGIASYGGDYQAVETLCDGLDNDCDGIVDEGCDCIDGNTQPCGTNVGACMAGVQTCTAGAWGGCAGETAPTAEICDGLDNDCNGTPDDGVVGALCPLQQGVCSGTRQRCGGAAGFLACSATDYGVRYQATETLCDGLDNDCDGVVDEGCDCIDGATQACGTNVGRCERGTQTCVAGAWGACTGGVVPRAELCNGLDDDCNGLTDDGLDAPACALSEGVCSGARQICGGAAGWLACDATSYGPSYVATENGGTNEALCDGLDNDCNGVVDDGCASGPLLTDPSDLVYPRLRHRHLVYLQNFDGNWDVVFANFDTGEARRLTATAANEEFPRISGNHVVYLRGEGAARRAVHYDLTTDVERVISTGETLSAEIDGGTIVFDQLSATSSWDVFLYDIETRVASPLFDPPSTAAEFEPALRAGTLSFIGEVAGTFVTHVVDFTATPPTVTAQSMSAVPGAGQRRSYVDHRMVAWTDGASVADAMPGPMSNWNVRGANLYALAPIFPAAGVFTSATGAQLLSDLDGSLAVWSDFSNGNYDPVVGQLGGAPLFISTSPATQADPTISGDLIVWEDNRRGTFDLYAAALVGIGIAPEAGFLVINEVLADPPTGADVNGDGVASTTNDEFVEIINVAPIAVDLSGVTLSDAVMVRHTFAPGTVLPALGSIVVFGGGGSPGGLFGGARIVNSSTGSLSLNNDGDTVTLRLGGTTIDSMSYGAAGGNDQSLVRSPEGSTAAPFVQHTTVRADVRYSPGTSIRGFAF